MAIRNFERDDCSGCGNCVAACPMDVFRMDEEDDKAWSPIRMTASPAGAVNRSVHKGVSTSRPSVLAASWSRRTRGGTR